MREAGVVRPLRHIYPGLLMIWVPLVVSKDYISGVLLKDIEFRLGISLCPMTKFWIFGALERAH
jgi:hypothetical protein